MNLQVSKSSKPKSKMSLGKLFHTANDKDRKKIFEIQTGRKGKDLLKFYKRTLFVDSNPGLNCNCRRLLYGSYMYKKPKWIFPMDENRQTILSVNLQTFNSNPNGSIFYFPAHSYGFYCCWNSKDWLKNVRATILLLLKSGKHVVVKLHPGDKKRFIHEKKLRQYFPTIEIPQTIDLDNIMPYACVSDGGAICVKLALLGYPLFCFHKHKVFFLCRFVSSFDHTLLTKELEESMFPSRNDFLNLVCSHTFTHDEIKQGIVHNLLAQKFK
mgnify:CR=1 FL=1|tara:strand:+ start:10168 stop:10974 length:807 start_codon:yes stop_codon:yes gene_type:complete